MTSSLVGSEMCIRDRPAKAPPSHIQQSLQSTEVHQSIRASPTSNVLIKTCLLYTSDAADDM
eukprot:4090936-Prorocentrum_lima.AAC.1